MFYRLIQYQVLMKCTCYITFVKPTIIARYVPIYFCLVHQSSVKRLEYVSTDVDYNVEYVERLLPPARPLKCCENDGKYLYPTAYYFNSIE